MDYRWWIYGRIRDERIDEWWHFDGWSALTIYMTVVDQLMGFGGHPVGGGSAKTISCDSAHCCPRLSSVLSAGPEQPASRLVDDGFDINRKWTRCPRPTEELVSARLVPSGPLRASDWDKWWWRNSVEVEFEPWCCSKVTGEEEEQILTVIKKCNDLEHPASLHSKYFVLTDGGDVEARTDGELGRFEKMLREAAQPLVIHLSLTDPLTSARSGRIDVILSWISSQIAAVHVCAWMSDTQAINRQIR